MRNGDAPTKAGASKTLTLFKPIEWVIFIATMIACAVGIHGLVTGYITI
jgi:arginine:ornithine antiporter/lysine permease